ncbi:MAG: sensor histidine kinase [Caldilineae bacterium]|nr:MAG: sensor histidine kinase [Caldilineae bacterium]
MKNAQRAGQTFKTSASHLMAEQLRISLERYYGVYSPSLPGRPHPQYGSVWNYGCREPVASLAGLFAALPQPLVCPGTAPCRRRPLRPSQPERLRRRFAPHPPVPGGAGVADCHTGDEQPLLLWGGGSLLHAQRPSGDLLPLAHQSGLGGAFHPLHGGSSGGARGAGCAPHPPHLRRGVFLLRRFCPPDSSGEEARHESQQLLAALQEAHRQLQEYAVQVEELAVAQERNRLAREMHDTLGHRLTVSVVQLEGAERLIPDDPARATQMVKTVREQVRAALGELRRIVAALRPPLEADLPLPRAIVRLTDEFQKATGIAVHRSLPPAIPPLPPAWRLTLYRTVQEGLTNVQRHADARRVWLAVQVNDQMLTLRLSDDGRGWSPGEPQQGFGLRGLRERAHQLGGELHLETGLKGGAAIILRLPLPAEGRDD